jgi:hypothetical protein
MFLVLYEWRARPGKEEQFREGWRRGTRAITRRYGSFGSRLCRTDDGRFIGVAEWPDKATWQAAMALGMAHCDAEASAIFDDARLDGGAPVLQLEVLDDLLIG